MKLSVLGSGSGGNCIYLATARTRILIDAGFGIRSLRRRCKEAGLCLNDLDAILITHGHCDHVAGVSSLLRNYDAEVFMNEGTRNEVPVLRDLEHWQPFVSGKPFEIGDFSFEAFPTPHDAAESVGFSVSAEGVKGAVATDLGELTPAIADMTRGTDWLILESNHDEELLKVGPYPWALKRRVLGRLGHLSNAALAEFMEREFDGAASHLFLAHLSRQNNDPELARTTISAAIERRREPSNGHSLQIHLTDQTNPSIVLDL